MVVGPIAFNKKQAELTKKLVDDALDIYQVSLAISRVRNSIEASDIDISDDIDMIAEICDQVIDGYSFSEFTSDDLLHLVLENNQEQEA